jgi:putative lipoic acid-binding regulatory protein
MWQYKAIGRDKSLLERAINEIFAGCRCEIRYANSSRTGKYHSYAIDLEVSDDESRIGYYQLLNSHAHVLMVI